MWRGVSRLAVRLPLSALGRGNVTDVAVAVRARVVLVARDELLDGAILARVREVDERELALAAGRLPRLGARAEVQHHDRLDRVPVARRLLVRHPVKRALRVVPAGGQERARIIPPRARGACARVRGGDLSSRLRSPPAPRPLSLPRSQCASVGGYALPRHRRRAKRRLQRR